MTLQKCHIIPSLLTITCITVNEDFHLFSSIFFISAKRHGYDYLRITSPPVPSHHDSWTKVVQLYDVLHRYDIVVLLDADAYIVNPNTSIEFLLERYNFTINSSILLAIDPNTMFNKDSKGRRTLNTGFIIAQNNNLTRYMLKQLALCTRTIPGCDQWKGAWSFERRAFSEYIRDQMKIGSELIIAPCEESNGYVDSNTECLGTFVAHMWSHKNTMGDRLQKTMLNNLMTFLEKEMWENHHSIVASTISDIEELEVQRNATNMSSIAST